MDKKTGSMKVAETYKTVEKKPSNSYSTRYTGALADKKKIVQEPKVGNFKDSRY